MLGMIGAVSWQVELTVSNAALRIIGTWAGGTIAHGVMTSSLATRPYGESSLVAQDTD